ncbi:hypothetical protein [Chengkuizengella axinellae]|uniref:Spore coat protein n=1 Tax=Chengkuizengella axinellae TaxID=3064388 RepID=A0ABT9ITX1_9BACL|nr:hypothetical protein [Chengkuizengella sp. 2205SS18-9]MDP5272796.1 hypothetical protein [Chengkuizengella sp. 2205SS18-9]
MEHYRSQNNVCCPISCAGIQLIPKELISIKRCVPIRDLCDGFNSFAILFIAQNIPINSPQLPKGIITLVNTSSDPECTMALLLLDSNALIFQAVSAQSSINVEVDRLFIAIAVCFGPDPTQFCTGTFEADLQYEVIK